MSFFRNRLFTKIYFAIISILVLFGLGVCTYVFYFDYSWVDAFYMTTITIATVGFGEVQALDESGKLFTSFLIIASIFIFGYSVTTLSSYLLNEDYWENFRLKNKTKLIKRMKNHVIICGYGRNGKQTAKKLKKFNKDFLVIDEDSQVFHDSHLRDEQILIANSLHEKTLEDANIANAQFLILTLPSDADNVFIALTAKQLNKNIIIYSRASEESSVKKLKIAGVESVILPDKVGGDHLASLVVSPDLVEFFDNLMVDGHPNVVEIYINNAKEGWVIENLEIEEKTGCRTIGYKTKEGEFKVNPPAKQPIFNGDRIIVIGSKDQIAILNKINYFLG
ncbi:MAG: potassium channel protein [Saprospiraceae bacterium]